MEISKEQLPEIVVKPTIQELDKDERLKYYIDNINKDYFRVLEYLNNESMYDSQYRYYEKLESLAKLDFLDTIMPKFAKIDRSNGSRLYQKIDLKVGIICDEFLYHSYKDVTNLVYIPYTMEGLDESLDFLIVASAWSGIDGSWAQVASPRSEAREHLLKLIARAHELKVPTAFYSKEDPVNYHLFKDIAKACDIVYTSAVEMVEQYKAFCGHDRVYTMEFGINPLYHNPVGSRTDYAERHKNHVLFAGSWTEKYPVRNKEAAQMFDGVLDSDYDLTIIDRNLNLRKSRYQFPEKYLANLTSPMVHEDLMNAHRLFRWAINVNSVKYSETMFANRVYELQAMGNLMLTNYSVGVNNKFPNLLMVNTPDDVKPMLTNYSEAEYEDLRAKGIRQVMLEETTYHRINRFAEHLNIPVRHLTWRILVIGSDSDKVRASFERQLYPHKQFVLERDVTPDMIQEYDFVTYFSEDFIYEEYHLRDLLAGFAYADVDYITKSNLYLHTFSENYKDRALTMFDSSCFDGLTPETKQGYNIPKTEIFTKPYQGSSDKELSVIIPIHNNGRYLEDKCVRSLSRSSIFSKMEMIFVNDGSTDPETIQIIERLRRRYANITYLEFPEGSGSASRPRNEGARIVQTKYMTYLDPDNEATGDGYAELYETLSHNPELDMVVGNILKEDNMRKATFNYHGTVKKYNGSSLITDTHQFMKDSGLRAQSIQAVIIKTAIIQDNDIRMVEGAAGQDTMFFQELMLYSNNVLAINTLVHIYYAAVSGSVTNTIGKKFFDKYYALEIERIPFLKKQGLLETYMEQRFNFYVKGWYLARIDRIRPEERNEAITRFLDIYSLYDDINKHIDNDLKDTIDQLKAEVSYRQ